jgi:uncharacterized protein (DUF302 family)
VTNRLIAAFPIALLVLFAFVPTSYSADDGLITTQSRYSVKETIARFEEAVKAKESLGFMVFTEIDHTAAAKKLGLRCGRAL